MSSNTQISEDSIHGESDPVVLHRTFEIPAGLPWEQAKAADLDARHGAPLPVSELKLQVRRLEPWRPGRLGKFVVFYVRSRDLQGYFETVVDVDGQRMPAAFGKPPGQNERAIRAALIAASIGSSVALVAVGLTLALSARSQAEARLSALEQAADRRLSEARRAEAAVKQLEELERLALPSKPLSDVLADLSWVASERTEDSRILSVHWDAGLLAITSVGEAPPLKSSNLLEKSSVPVRPGVWLWAVTEPGPGSKAQ